MTDPTFDAGGYPTEETLAAIREWPTEGFCALMDFVERAWKYPEYFHRRGRTFRISTGGWSGNEDIIEALRNHLTFWITCWAYSRRGGHYVFEIPKCIPKPKAKP